MIPLQPVADGPWQRQIPFSHRTLQAKHPELGPEVQLAPVMHCSPQLRTRHPVRSPHRRAPQSSFLSAERCATKAWTPQQLDDAHCDWTVTLLEDVLPDALACCSIMHVYCESSIHHQHSLTELQCPPVK
eukprot:1764471-Amphidinium_carterae.1